MNKAQIILKSKCIFTSLNENPINGYIAICGNKIIKVSSGHIDSQLIDENTVVYNLGNKTISPGFADSHVFFSGWMLRYIGFDLSSAKNTQEMIDEIKQYSKTLNPKKTIFAHGYCFELNIAELQILNELYVESPIVLFSQDGESFWINEASRNHYGFDLDADCNEVFWKLIEEVLDDHDFSKKLYKDYVSLLNSRGVTMVKEIGYDTFSTFTQVLEELEDNSELTLRVNFMSQPVKEGANFEYGRLMRDKFRGDFVRFSGFNRMTDGSISQMDGFLKEPYNNTDIYCNLDIDWERIESEVLEADANDFRFSLNAQGNAAVAKVINIFSKCKKDINNHLVNRHAITEAEYADVVDIEKMGKLGLICEFYPQIQAISDYDSKVNMIKDKIGLKRGKNYWNRRKMLDFGVYTCCGTDLPLVIDDIPKSFFHTVTGKFSKNTRAFNAENTLSVEEILKAWTIGGAYDMYREAELGTIEVGKLADIAVFDKNIFETDIDDMDTVKICFTIVDGKIVYNNL
ncbi:MAG: amidohydrolase family protein [Sphaerochaetaceae bacterium]|nr:amidohydrolase family protein [Sphaerochaetaceae bacterium]